MQHYEESVHVPAAPETVFAFADDHKNFSAHMNKSNWMMAGSKMETTFDEGGGKQVGSHIKMTGKALGISLYLDEVVTQHQPPLLKVWETVGTPKLLVVGHYIMKYAVSPKEQGSTLVVSIDYDLPQTNAWIGKLFGGMYAKWCVRQMIQSVAEKFKLPISG